MMQDILFLNQNKCNNCGNHISNCICLFKINENQTLLKCKVCGLIFNDRMRIDFSNIYNLDYYEGGELKTQDDGYVNYESIEKGLNRDYRFAYDFIVNRSNNYLDCKLLDIGCGYGFFLKQFISVKNFKVEGIELSEHAYRKAKTVIPTVYNMSIEKIHLPNSNYDFITMFELIEHMINPSDLLKKIYGLLKNEGYLIISTPDVSNFTFNLLKKRWPAIHPNVHNYYFSPLTLRRICRNNGFKEILIFKHQCLWKNIFHIRQRIFRKHPKLKMASNFLAPIDTFVIPFPGAGSINAIFQKVEGFND